jgi:uncharacterized protein YijF (DUF1287 family)
MIPFILSGCRITKIIKSIQYDFCLLNFIVMKKGILLVLGLMLCSAQTSDFFTKLAEYAEKETANKVTYVPDYVRIPYPGGDVPSNTGVCTDLVIRTYRKLGIDLQKEVHEDMQSHFSVYPKFWGRKTPDPNIDHRRVPNLMTFFTRKGKKLAISNRSEDYKPGDLVTWNLRNKNSASGITHIGIVSSKKNLTGDRHLIAHNIGNGNELSDMLFDYTIIGHYRYSD